MRTRLILVALCTGVFSAMAIADDAHHPDEKTQAVPAKPAPRTAPSSTDSTAMQANMKRMHEQMAQIQAAPDPKERQRLMDEHMKTMRESMSKMNGMMSAGKPMDSRERMDMMERQMGMMQMMMQQMMDHEAEAHPASK